ACAGRWRPEGPANGRCGSIRLCSFLSVLRWSCSPTGEFETGGLLSSEPEDLGRKPGAFLAPLPQGWKNESVRRSKSLERSPIMPLGGGVLQAQPATARPSRRGARCS